MGALVKRLGCLHVHVFIANNCSEKQSHLAKAEGVNVKVGRTGI